MRDGQLLWANGGGVQPVREIVGVTGPGSGRTGTGTGVERWAAVRRLGVPNTEFTS